MRPRATWPDSDRSRGWRGAARRAARFAAAVPRSRSSQQLRPFLNFGDDARKDFIGVTLAVDDHESLRLGDCQRSISLANAAMKPQVLRLESPLVAYRLGISRARAREAGFFRQIEKQREVGHQRIGRPRVERSQLVEIDEASETLIRERGVGEAIAE